HVHLQLGDLPPMAGDPRAYPMGSVHPADGEDALTEIDRVAEAGARGLKLHPHTQAFDVAERLSRAVSHRRARRGQSVRRPARLDLSHPRAGSGVVGKRLPVLLTG